MNVDVYQAREAVLAGSALLVCAYDSRESFEQARLEGALSLEELQARVAELPRETRLFVYCA